MIPFRVDFAPGVPVSEQVLFAAKKAILSGRLPPGSPFPSVRILARETKIHANTAAKVVAQLAAEGLIEIQPGIGAIVASPPARNGRVRLLASEIERLTVQALQLGISPGDLQTAISETFRRLSPKEPE